MRWSPYTNKTELLKAAAQVKAHMASADSSPAASSQTFEKEEAKETEYNAFKKNVTNNNRKSSLLAAATAVAATAAASADFESKHPRNKDGEFTDKGEGGGNNSPKDNNNDDNVNDAITANMSEEEIKKMNKEISSNAMFITAKGNYYVDDIHRYLTTNDNLKNEINSKYPLPPRKNTINGEKLFADTTYDALMMMRPMIHVDDQEIFWKAWNEVESKAFLNGNADRMNSQKFKTGMEQLLDKTNTVYRGTDAERTLELLKTGILDGANPDGTEYNYTPEDKKDFVSTTMDYIISQIFAGIHDNPIIVRFDTTDMKPETDYHVMDYQTKPDLHVWDPARENVNDQKYRPDEKYGGSHPARYAKELEVQLKRGITPKISKIIVPTDDKLRSNKIYSEIERFAKSKGIPVEAGI